jgi:hypothetical protein
MNKILTKVYENIKLVMQNGHQIMARWYCRNEDGTYRQCCSMIIYRFEFNDVMSELSGYDMFGECHNLNYTLITYHYNNLETVLYCNCFDFEKLD